LFKLVRNSLVTAALVVQVAACQSGSIGPTAPPTEVASTAVTVAPTAIPLATALPTATTAPEPAPTGSAAGNQLPAAKGTPLEAGRYSVGETFMAPLSIEVPAASRVDALREGSVAISGPSGWLGVFVADAVYPDPCRSGDPVRAVTSDALVTALQGMTGFTSSLAIPSELDGRRTRSFDLDNDIDTGTADCAGGPMLPLFRSIGNPDGEATNGGTHQRLWVVDGAPWGHIPPRYEGPVLIVADGWATDADLQVLSKIVASIDFE
jgi:hypothetical protein